MSWLVDIYPALLQAMDYNSEKFVAGTRGGFEDEMKTELSTWGIYIDICDYAYYNVLYRITK